MHPHQSTPKVKRHLYLNRANIDTIIYSVDSLLNGISPGPAEGSLADKRLLQGQHPWEMLGRRPEFEWRLVLLVEFCWPAGWAWRQTGLKESGRTAEMPADEVDK